MIGLLGVITIKINPLSRVLEFVDVVGVEPTRTRGDAMHRQLNRLTFRSNDRSDDTPLFVPKRGVEPNLSYTIGNSGRRFVALANLCVIDYRYSHPNSFPIPFPTGKRFGI